MVDFIKNCFNSLGLCIFFHMHFKNEYTIPCMNILTRYFIIEKHVKIHTRSSLFIEMPHITEH
jgi:hypothetical protein